MHREPRSANEFELAGLASALIHQAHPAISGCTTSREVLEFLIEHCAIAVFDGYSDTPEDPSGSVIFLLMDQGPEFVSIARWEAGASLVRLTHATLEDFAPYEAPSRHASSTLLTADPHSGVPRAPTAPDLRDFLRMFRSVNDPFLMDELKNDMAREEYLRDHARIAILDQVKSGAYSGPVAFFLWPAGPRFVTMAIKTNMRWRFASAETSE